MSTNQNQDETVASNFLMDEIQSLLKQIGDDVEKENTLKRKWKEEDEKEEIVEEDEKSEEDEGSEEDEKSEEENVFNIENNLLNKIEGSKIYVITLNGEPFSYTRNEETVFELAQQFANNLCATLNKESYYKQYFVSENDGVYSIFYSYKFLFHLYDNLSDVIEIYSIHESSI